MNSLRTDHTHEFDPMDIQNNKGVACVSYLGPLFIIPLLSAPNSKFAKFHANQGLLLFITFSAGSIMIGILSFALSIFFFWSRIIPSILTGIISGSYGIFCFIVALVLLIEASNGKAKELPFIGKYRLIS